ncbi:hypothetical protein GQ55_4G114100 [Panicum hallii var. hallii]|uniref:Uncharacterized protein n=1 Tax=Panicum hallii var. hallii TaxID=1504633 RepID=A0A2T7DXK8_9POAL|nr:hypothetical protein GQ55_4G114100 [Panicum hallii var. hallii]
MVATPVSDAEQSVSRDESAYGARRWAPALDLAPPPAASRAQLPTQAASRQGRTRPRARNPRRDHDAPGPDRGGRERITSGRARNQPRRQRAPPRGKSKERNEKLKGSGKNPPPASPPRRSRPRSTHPRSQPPTPSVVIHQRTGPPRSLARPPPSCCRTASRTTPAAEGSAPLAASLQLQLPAGNPAPGVNMLHHSNSRNQRNRGSRIKTLLQATLLVGVIFWLLYQVKHSYDKKNEYLDDAEDQPAHNDRSMFQGRKEKAGSYSDSNVEVVGEPEEGAVDHHSDTFDHNEKGGEIVFDKDSTDLHGDDKRNTELPEAEKGQVNSADGNTEAHSNNSEDETTGHAEENKHDTESNSDAEGKSEVHSTGDDMSQNNQAQEESTGETSGTSHDEVVQGDESTSASGNGSDGEEGEKKETVGTQTGSESLPDDTKTETSDDHSTGSLPDETGNIPSLHTENSQNDSSENQGGEASTTSGSSEHGTGEAVHIETGLEGESATASSGTGSGDDKGSSSDNTSAEEKTGTASDDDGKGAETGTSNEAPNSLNNSAATDQAANTEAENSQGGSSGEGVNGSSEETSNNSDGATETSSNGGQVDPKIETSTSTNDEHNESQGGDGGSGSSDSNGSGPEQTGKTESQ